jgi:hypothetical protein
MSKNPQQADYEKLGKAVENILVKDHVNIVQNWKRFILVNFGRGLPIGLGSIIGATLIVALLLWILSLFGELPFVGDIFDSVRSTINKQDIDS